MMSFASGLITDVTLESAVAALKQGRLVAFPTETVYGLGADAENPAALELLYATKERPSNHPVIVHLAPSARLEDWAVDIPEGAYRLAEAFWPGPLTLILSRATRVPDAVTGGQDTVGLRVPAHPLTQQLLESFGGGVAGPSANRFGRLSPTSAQHVRADLGDRVDIILDGGACPVGVESTIVAFREGQPVILRPGMITAEKVEAALMRFVIPGASLSLSSSEGAEAQSGHQAYFETSTPRKANGVTTVSRAPGTLARHYAPQTPMTLLASAALKQEIIKWQGPGRLGVLAWRTKKTDLKTDNIPEMRFDGMWLQASDNPDDYARELYAYLRQLDQSDVAALYVEAVPDADDWAAIADRLRRAAHR